MPGLPLRFIPVGQIAGDDEGAESIALPSVLSAGGSINLTFDKFARVSAIGGYLKQNSGFGGEVRSNAANNAMLLRAIIPYAKQAAGVITRQQIGIFDDEIGAWEARLTTNLGQYWAFLKDFGVGSVARIPQWCALGNQGILVNGYIPVYGWDGAILSEVTSTQLAAPTVVDAGVGNLSGTYRWKVVVRKSDGTRKPASKWSARTALAGRKATVTWGADGEAASYEIYRTSGTGEVGLFVGSVVTGTLSFTDNVADLDLINGRMLQEYGDIPPVGVYFVFIHKSRVFYLRTDLAPRTAYYSDPGLPFSVHFDASFLDMTDAESFSDVAAGGTGNFENMAVVWLERSIWTISGTGNQSGIVIDFQRRRSSARVGTCHVNTVARVSAGALFLDARGQLQTINQNVLAYLTPFGDLRVFDGKWDTIIGFGKADLLKRLNYAQRRKSFVAVDTPRDELTWVFAVDDSTEPNAAVTWNTKYGTMTERSWPFACVAEVDTADDSSVLLAGEARKSLGGFCYLLWDNSSVKGDGTPIGSQFMSKTFYGLGNSFTKSGMADAALLQFDKRWRWIDLLVKTSGMMTFLIEWFAGEAKPEETSFGWRTLPLSTSALTSSDGSPLTTSDASALVAPNTAAPVRGKLKNVNERYLHARGMRFRLSQYTFASLVPLLRPMAWWPLGDTSTTFLDSGSQKIDGTESGGSIGGTAGSLGDRSLAHTVTSPITMGDVAQLEFQTNFTLYARIKFSSASTMIVMGKALQTTAKGYLLYLTAGKFRFGAYDSAGNEVWSEAATQTAAFNDDLWHDVAAVYDGSNAMVYVDGVLKTTTPRIGVRVIDQNAAPFALGGYGDLIGTFLSATLDEVMVFSRVLTATEILWLHDAAPEVPRDWSLAGFTVSYQVLTGLKRRFRR